MSISASIMPRAKISVIQPQLRLVLHESEDTTTNAAEQVNLKPQSVLVLGHGNYRCLSTGCTYSDLPLCAYYLIAARRETTCQLPSCPVGEIFSRRLSYKSKLAVPVSVAACARYPELARYLAQELCLLVA